MENWHPPYSRGGFCAATAGNTPQKRSERPGQGREYGQCTGSCAKRPFPAQKCPDETIFMPYAVVLKQTGNVVAASKLKRLCHVDHRKRQRRFGKLGSRALVHRDRPWRRDPLPRLSDLTNGSTSCPRQKSCRKRPRSSSAAPKRRPIRSRGSTTRKWRRITGRWRLSTSRSTATNRRIKSGQRLAFWWRLK